MLPTRATMSTSTVKTVLDRPSRKSFMPAGNVLHSRAKLSMQRMAFQGADNRGHDEMHQNAHLHNVSRL